MSVHLTNGNTMLPLHTATFKNLLLISNISKQCQICTQHTGPTLLSLGKLCDDDYIVVADKNKCIIYKDKPVLRAQRCLTTGIYVMDLTNLLLKQSHLHTNL